MKIFTYWENPAGKVTPPYIEACLDSMRRHCAGTDYEFILLTPDNIGPLGIWKMLHANYAHLRTPAHRADCVRVAAITKYGGLWVDADFLMIRSPYSFFSKIASATRGELYYTSWDDGRVLNGYFYAPEGSSVMKEWLARVNTILYRAVHDGAWTTFGEQILTPLVRYKFPELCRPFHREFFIPINTDKIPNLFYEPYDSSLFLLPYSVGVNLNHSFFAVNFPSLLTMPLATVKTMPNVIGDLFRRYA
jgi:hypothetical protein